MFSWNILFEKRICNVVCHNWKQRMLMFMLNFSHKSMMSRSNSGILCRLKLSSINCMLYIISDLHDGIAMWFVQAFMVFYIVYTCKINIPANRVPTLHFNIL